MAKRRASGSSKPPKWFIPAPVKGAGVEPPAQKKPEKKSGLYVRPVEEIPIVDPLVDVPLSGDFWPGWSNDMPAEYYLCPSCLASSSEKHLLNCPRPDMQRIGWACPTCTCEAGTPHTTWCARADWNENPFKIRVGLSRQEFLDYIGFKEQTWFGKGHPTPRNKRIDYFLFLDAGNFTDEPWKKPTLTRDEQNALQQKLSPDFDDFPDDILEVDPRP